MGNTIFSKIIDKEIPADIVFESDNILAFRDINPQAPVHILIIPKIEIPTITDIKGSEHALLLGEMYDAAKMDGCSRFKQIFHITLPSIRPTIITLLILAVGHIISVGFDKILLMYSPATYDVADVISTYVYRKGIFDQDYGFSSAIGLFNSLVSVVFLLGANYFSRKHLDESLW